MATSQLLEHTYPSFLEEQEIMDVYLRESALYDVPGYLYSYEMEPALFRYSVLRNQPIYQKEDKPRWNVDVCVSVPEAKDINYLY